MDHEPIHFVRTNTKLTKESLDWIINNLSGRYFLAPEIDGDPINTLATFFDKYYNMVPSFEDPGEAMMYELKWS